MADDKLTIEQFARKLKEANPQLASVPDEVLARKVFERRPDLMGMVQTSESREGHKMKTPDPGVLHGMGQSVKGVAAPLTGEYWKDAGKNFLLNWAAGHDKRPDNPYKKQLEDRASNDPRDLLGKRSVEAAQDVGHPKEAFGQALGTGLMTGLPFLKLGKAGAGAGALGEVTEIGKGAKVDAAAMDAAKTVSAPVRTLLDSQIEGIDKGMAGQFVDVKTLRADISRAAKMMDKIERAPGMQVKDVSAAKDVVSRLQSRAKQGMLTWSDARELYKEINNAQSTVKGASAVRANLGQIADSLQEQLKATAKAAGKEAEYNKWVTDYKDLSRWERGYAKTVKGQTAQQMEAKATASPGTKIPKTNITIGGSDKTAKIAKQQIKNAHKALEELHGRVKSSPSGGQPPPAPTAPSPTGQPPAGGAPPTVTPGGAGVVPTTQSPTGPMGTGKSVVQGAGTSLNSPGPTPPPQMVGTAAGAASDTDLFQQAKQALGPNASISDIAQKAQQLKMDKANKSPF